MLAQIMAQFTQFDIGKSSRGAGTSCSTAALIPPEPGDAHRRAELPGLCLLLTGNGDGTLEYCCAFTASG
jgi:hypothetical protein